MKFTKKVQYGLLLTLYISRAGRSTIEAAAHNMGLSRSFLEQVARKLRLSGIIKSIRGPSGGYEIVAHPKVEDVVLALSPQLVLTPDEFMTLDLGAPECRALSLYSKTLKRSIKKFLQIEVKCLNENLVTEEINYLFSAQSGDYL